MKISELQLKLQLTTSLEVQKQCKATIKENMGTLDTILIDYMIIFDQAMSYE